MVAPEAVVSMVPSERRLLLDVESLHNDLRDGNMASRWVSMQ